jgi:hypothetical protein
MLYEPSRFDALIDEPWAPARVDDTIAAIVADADADAAFDPTACGLHTSGMRGRSRCRY